jgi:hypothetical protein
MLIDGAKVAEIAQRQHARDEANLLLRTFVEEGMLGPAARIDVVFTKWDIGGSNKFKKEAEPFADRIYQELKARFAPRVAAMRSFKIVARDPEGRVPPAHGLEDALPAWVEAGPDSASQLRRKLIEPTAFVEYDRFLRRQMPRLFEPTT